MEKILRLKVKTNAKEDKILEQTSDLIKIQIRAKPVKGKANQYLIKFLKKELNCNVEILKGKTSTDKLLKLSF